MGECKNDIGGYFIIDGKEKAIVSQEKFADNALYVKKYSLNSDIDDDDEDIDITEDPEKKTEIKLLDFLYSAQIVSVSENISKFARTFSVKMVGPTKSLTNMNLVVNIPNVKAPVPLFILFRALGIISDKDIISFCILDLDKYGYMIDLFAPSIHDSGGFYTQSSCLNFIGLLTKGKSNSHAQEILVDYLLPHIGKQNFIEKAYYLGYMVFRILCIHVGIDKPTDRDNFKYKRVELVGPLLNNLFNEYYKIQNKKVRLAFEGTLYYNRAQFESNMMELIMVNYVDVFKKNNDLEVGIRKAFKGNWGAQSHTKRIGVVQGLDRLSFNSMMSHLRKIVLPLDSNLKIVEPRKLHCSHWGFIDPIDTPDGSKIGFHKNLSISTQVTRGYSKDLIIKWIKENITICLIENTKPLQLSLLTKVFVNGSWICSVAEPIHCVEKIRSFRRNGLIPIYTSVTFDIRENIIYVYTDGGRLCRPIFYTKDNSFLEEEDNDVKKRIHEKKFTWNNLITGFNRKKADINFDPNDCNIYKFNELYDNKIEDKQFSKNKAILDFIDCSETENAFIMTGNNNNNSKRYTHCEIHESLILGMMGNQITFPETNPMARNLFSCGQSKQAVSLYHTNYQMRMDKSSMVLNYGQSPLLRSRYGQYINHEENPYGENTIVAIMCYTGYNVEDAILINEASLQRGLFRTSYFTTYETHEEDTVNAAGVSVDKKITDMNKGNDFQNKKVGHNYSKLDMQGIIREGETVDEKTVLIGFTSNNVLNYEKRIDISITPKKGQLGTVFKSYITEGEEGERIAKVRVVDQRIPAIGDKFASRVGQKGTIGMVIKEVDMPFTSSGIRPDIIINPHAIPSRMTIGQLVESITGKACALYGGYGDSTAFNQNGSKVGLFGEMLVKEGFHSKGNEILYNGMTG
jgi:DNA-directed RNA polymerase II subunit RPB2